MNFTQWAEQYSRDYEEWRNKQEVLDWLCEQRAREETELKKEINHGVKEYMDENPEWCAQRTAGLYQRQPQRTPLSGKYLEEIVLEVCRKVC
jgi:hypothetical protein